MRLGLIGRGVVLHVYPGEDHRHEARDDEDGGPQHYVDDDAGGGTLPNNVTPGPL